MPGVFDFEWTGRAMVPHNPKWAKEALELKELMEKLQSDHFSHFQSYRGGIWEHAKSSMLNAHYTSPGSYIARLSGCYPNGI